MNDDLNFIQPKKVVGNMIDIKAIEDIKAEIAYLPFTMFDKKEVLDRQEVIQIINKHIGG